MVDHVEQELGKAVNVVLPFYVSQFFSYQLLNPGKIEFSLLVSSPCQPTLTAVRKMWFTLHKLKNQSTQIL